MRITHLDCFSGAGGFCTGLKAAGISTIAAIEKVASCAETYSANHPEVKMIRADIRKVVAADLHRAGVQSVDIVTAGMPCETFSTAGSKSRSFYDFRQTLYREALRLASIADAKLILFENVPAITTKRVERAEGSKLIIEQIFDDLAAAGYKYYVDCILNAVDFGVPQTRERFFILAARERLDLRTPVSKRNGRISVSDAFKGLPAVSANSEVAPSTYAGGDSDYSRLLKSGPFWNRISSTRKLTYHIPPNHRPGTLRRFDLIRPGEGLRDLFEKFSPDEVRRLQQERVLPRKWYIQRNRRLIGAQPSVTVTSHCLDELLHPQENRALTVREVARLQSFPDWYDFKGGPVICPHIYETQDKYEQIGDAVPPLLAYHWGKVLTDILVNGHRHQSRQPHRHLVKEKTQPGNGANSRSVYKTRAAR